MTIKTATQPSPQELTLHSALQAFSTNHTLTSGPITKLPEARQVRRDASFLGQTIMSGYRGMSSEVTALLQDANDEIAGCNAAGVEP